MPTGDEKTRRVTTSSGSQRSGCGATEITEVGIHVSAETVHVHDGDLATSHEAVKITAKAEGMKKPLFTLKAGDDFHRDSGTWKDRYLLVDRRREPHWFTERIVDPATGEVLHSCDEPLADHRGRGSARRRDLES
jgi:hypothetical protein